MKRGILALALLASITSIGNHFAVDDVRLILHDRRVHTLAHSWSFLVQPYWPHSTLYRPLTSLGFAVQWQLGGGAPWLYHALSIVLYILACLVVYQLARQLLGRAAAWWAAALFAVHPVHVEAVGNIVGQSELWAGLCVVTAVGHYIAVRRSGLLRPRDIALVAVLYAAGCMFKEHALMLPALLFAAELTVLGSRLKDLFKRKELRVLAAALVLIAALFWTAHTLVAGSFVGERAVSALAWLSTRDRLLTMLGVVPEWVRLLVAPIHLQADYLPQEIPIAHGIGPRQALGLLLLVTWAAVAIRNRRSHPVIAFGLCWCAVTLFPVSNVVAATGLLLAERTLFLPSVGAVLVAGAGIEWISAGLDAAGLRTRRVAAFGGALLLLAGVARSAIRQPVWRDSDTYLAHALMDSPLSYRVHWTAAHRAAARRDHAAVEREFNRALELFGHDPRLLGEMADRYGTISRCPEALPLYARALELNRRAPFDRRRYIHCLVAEGRNDEARVAIAAARAMGYRMLDPPPQ